MDATDGKVYRIRESPSNPKKSIVYTRPPAPSAGPRTWVSIPFNDSHNGGVNATCAWFVLVSDVIVLQGCTITPALVCHLLVTMCPSILQIYNTGHTAGDLPITHINNLISPDNSTNPKRLYSYIKNQRKDQSGIQQLQDKDGFIRSDSLTKANILNQHFQSVFTQNEDISTIPDKGISPHPLMQHITITPTGIRAVPCSGKPTCQF